MPLSNCFLVCEDLDDLRDTPVAEKCVRKTQKAIMSEILQKLALTQIVLRPRRLETVLRPVKRPHACICPGISRANEEFPVGVVI